MEILVIFLNVIDCMGPFTIPENRKIKPKYHLPEWIITGLGYLLTMLTKKLSAKTVHFPIIYKISSISLKSNKTPINITTDYKKLNLPKD